MRIRTRLLLLILPMVLVIILSISCLTYLTWYHDTLDHFRASLEAISVSSAQIIDPENFEWIVQHKDDPNILQNKLYQKYVQSLKNVRHKLPITSLYAVKIEPVQKGQRVLENKPLSEKNRIYNGKDESLAYRQVYILDTGSEMDEPFHPPGDEDFSESGEAAIYETKQPIVTPIYQAKSTGVRLLTAYAPILNQAGDVIGLVAADLSLAVIDQQAHKLQGLILIGALLTIILIMVGIVFIANNISQPVELLKNAALTLAAGNYGKKIEVEGPKEITELANTLNTMSECLREHLTRLEESSLVREKMIGEVECFRILQTKMVQGVADKFSHPNVRLKAIGISARQPHKPTVLEILENKEDKISCRFKEATATGFEGIYELIKGKEVSSFITVTLEKRTPTTWNFEYKDINMPKPLLWLTKKSEVAAIENEALIETGDLVIIVNQGLNDLMRKEGIVNNWFSRIFRHFADEGLSSCMALLANELAFLSQRNDLQNPLQAICIEIEKQTPSD